SVMQDSPPPSVSGVGAIGRTASELVIPLPATTQTLYVHTSVLGAHGGQNTGIVWETSDAARATVTEVSFVGGVSTARVTAVSGSAAGLAVTITARSVLNNAFHNSTNITIFQAGLAGINVSLVGGATAGSLTIPYAVADINARPTLTLIATFDLSAAAHSASISRDVTWVATPSNLVQIDAQSTPGAADRRATIRPLAAGVVTITAVGAHCGTISAVFTMEVVQAQPTSIRILGPGEREFYYETTIVLPRPDHLLLPFIQLAANSATGARAVVWSTNCGGAVLERLASSEQVAEVIASFRGIGAGVALVTAYHPASGHSATFSIIVNKADILGVELSAPNNATSASLFVPIVSVGSGEYGLPALYSREYIVLSANVMVQFGATSGVEWSIDNPYAARIVGSRFGTSVTIMAVNGSVGGEAVRVTVRATNPSANGAFKEATFDIVVIQAAVANISIGGATTSMVIPYNATAQHAMPYIMLSAGIDTHHMAPRTLSFASSCGGSVISIDTRETTFTSVIEVSVWAVAAGTSTVTVRSLADASQYATIIISVSKQGVSSVSIAPPPASSMVIVYPTPEAGRRGSIQLSAEVVTSYGAPEAVVWTSSDSTIASVDANGLVRAVRGSLEGLSVTITAASAIDGGLFDSVTLTIYQAGETYLSIVGPNANSAQYVMFIPWGDVADAVQLGFALCTILGGSLDAVLSWQSSREDVASVSESGLVMAHSAGQATIRLVSDSGSSAVFTIVVVEMSEPPTIHYIYITDADGNKGAAELELPYVLPSLNLMPTILLSANVGASNTAIEGGLTGVIWHICQSSYALAELLGSNGFVRILYHGTITIIATSTLNNQIYGTFTFTVTRAAPPQDNNGDNGNGGNGGDKPNENKLPEGYVRLILVCENYFGQARMEHIDMTLEQALEFVLPVLTLNIQGAIFLGWSLSRNGEILPSVMLVSVAGYENGAGYVTLLPAHMFDLEAGLDTLLLFAVWYLPADDDSNLGRNILLGAYIIVGVGAATAGIAGYIVQSKIKRRRKGEMSEWGMDN
ncbi:MAG: Ig-like domain-containing protein, partial [Firmicutes bacterium]|nr:Ig-like domain-containing protein [Bacillota bacterium]